jgi:hypothetical protein
MADAPVAESQLAPSQLVPGQLGPSRGQAANALGPALVELGILKNGLGSIQNLELLIKSIKVGQKALFAAVAAVHVDCAPMLASVGALAEALSTRGADPVAVRRLADLLGARLRELEGALASSVRTGRLSVSQRLDLERQLEVAGRDLAASLPLVELLDAALRPAPSELVPLELVHASSADPRDPNAVPAQLVLPRAHEESGLCVDLAAAQLLIVVGVALAGSGARGAQVHIESEMGAAPRTRISLGSGPGTPVQIMGLRLVEPTLSSAQAAAQKLGGRLECAPEARQVCIYWPVP